MTATNHGLAGAGIAILLQKYPAVAMAVAPFSHFILDAIPHFGTNGDTRSKKFFRILFVDGTLAVVSTLYIAYLYHHIWWLVVLCAFLAASPDLMWIYYEYINPKLKKVHLVPKFHSWIQWSQTGQGVIVEVVWFILLISLMTFAGIAP